MRKHKNFIWLLVAAAVLIGVAILFVNNNDRNNMNLPDADLITRIEMEQISGLGTTSGSVFSTRRRDNINAIMSAFSGATRLAGTGANSAMNDTPFQESYLAIRPYVQGADGEEVLAARLFLYTEGGEERIFSSYVGIFKITQDDGNKIRRIYENR